MEFAATEKDRQKITSGTDQRKEGVRSSYVISLRVPNLEKPGEYVEKEVRISGTPRYDMFGKLHIEAFIEDYSHVKALEKAQLMDLKYEIMNAKAAQMHLNKLIARIQRHERSLESGIEIKKGITIGFADVDFLKFANDVNGHEEGDGLMHDVVRALKFATTRPQDDIYKGTDGDEFFVFLYDCNLEGANNAYRARLRDAISVANQERIKNYKYYLEQYIASG